MQGLGGYNGVSRGRLRLLLASSSVAALLGGGPAFAVTPCGSLGFSGASVASITNAGAAACIFVFNSTVSGNVTNTATGVLNALAAPSNVGITINNSTVGGAVINNGSITAPTAVGILIETNSTVAGGLTNGGMISAGVVGIELINLTTFGGGLTNTGKITATSHSGIFIDGVSTFSGNLSNSGTISGNVVGVNFVNVGTFLGSIVNSASGVISAKSNDAINVNGVTDFAGGLTNSGKIISTSDVAVNLVNISTFAGGITNSGLISGAKQVGILINGISVFTGGFSNSGTITGHTSGVRLANVSTFSGGFTNSGTITAASHIGVFINGSSTFSGGIGNSGMISGNLTGIALANITTFGGGLTNTGTIIGSSQHGILLNGVATFAGGVSNSGVVSGFNGGILIANVTTFSGGFTNSGTIGTTHGVGVEFNGVSTFAGNFVNSGTITGGTIGVQLSNITTIQGGITNTGTISSSVGIDIVGPPGVTLFDSGTIIGSGGTAIVFATANPNTLTLGPGFNIQGKVIGTGSDTFELGGTGNGAFNLSLIGSTQQYQGFTTFNVVSGVWTATGTFGQAQAWNVNGGTLAGTGSFQSVNVNNGGTLEPGTIGTPGTFMTINGNLAFQSGGMYLVNIGPTTASRANVTGAVTLNGAAAQGFLAPGSYNTKTTYDILDPSSISGKFSGFTAINAPGFGGTLTYNDNTDVLLNLTAQIGASGGLNTNQQNVANTINAFFNGGGTLPSSFFPAFGANPGSALSQLDGEDATGAERGAFDLMNEFLGLMLDPFVYGRGGSSTNGGSPLGFAPDQQNSFPPDVALAYAGLLKAPPPPVFQQRWTAWAAGFGGSAKTNGDPIVGSNTVTTGTYGYAAGMDYHYSPDTVFGFSLAGGGTNWNLANTLGTGRSDAFLAGAYGVTHNGPWYVGGALAFANNWFTTNRSVLGDQVTASFQGQSYAARLEGGYRYAVPVAQGTVGVTPYAALQVQDFHTPAFSETDLSGGGLGLAFNAMSGTDTRSELGGRFDDLTAWNNMPLVLRAKVAWAHDWVSNPALNASFESLPGTGFTVFGAPIPHDSALTTAGAQLFFTPNWSLLTKFDGEFASGYSLYAGSGTLRYTW